MKHFEKEKDSKTYDAKVKQLSSGKEMRSITINRSNMGGTDGSLMDR